MKYLLDTCVNAKFDRPSSPTTEEILADFPYLTHNDILACLAYAADREQQTLTIAG